MALTHMIDLDNQFTFKSIQIKLIIYFTKSTKEITMNAESDVLDTTSLGIIAGKC